jgi:hypothetical protein
MDFSPYKLYRIVPVRNTSQQEMIAKIPSAMSSKILVFSTASDNVIAVNAPAEIENNNNETVNSVTPIARFFTDFNPL